MSIFAAMAFNDRQEFILRQLHIDGQVAVENLARQWGVTTQTVRRDLGELCDAGLAQRMHGGARRMAATTATAYEVRRQANTGAKSAVAQAAAALIPNGASLALNIGTTTEMVAQALRQHDDLTVISNNINIVPILRASPLRSLVLIGGNVRPADGAIVGADAVGALANYKVDFAIIGASALDADGSILDFDEREVAVARAILQNARQSILVADVSKFAVTAPYRICAADALDHIVLDAAPPPGFAPAQAGRAPNLIIAGKANDQAN